MSRFDSFEKADLDVYAKGARNQGRVWVFQHIPKTAGTSLVQELRAAFPPYKGLNVNTAPAAEDGDTRDPKSRAIAAFVDEDKIRRFGSASGHLMPQHLREVRDALPTARFMTFLRDPAQRLVSDYRYSCSEKNPGQSQFVETYPTLGSYAESSDAANKMWRYVSGKMHRAKPDRIDQILRRYVFVGTVETLTEDFEFFSALTGAPRTLTARMNVSDDDGSAEVAVSKSDQEKIKLAVEEDQLFYDRVRAILDARREDMAAFVAARRAEWAGGAASPLMKAAVVKKTASKTAAKPKATTSKARATSTSKTTTSKTTTRKPAAKTATSKAPASKAPASKTTASKTTASKTAASKAPASKTAAPKTTARKTTPKRTTRKTTA